MNERNKNILKAMIAPLILALIIIVYAVYYYISTSDKQIAGLNLIIYVISAIGIFIFLTIIFYISINAFNKRKKVSDSIHAALYWRAKVRLISYLGTAIFAFFFFIIKYVLDMYIPTYSVIISIIISIIITLTIGFIIYDRYKTKAQEREEEWKKLDEERRQDIEKAKKEELEKNS